MKCADSLRSNRWPSLRELHLNCCHLTNHEGARRCRKPLGRRKGFDIFKPFSVRACGRARTCADSAIFVHSGADGALKM